MSLASDRTDPASADGHYARKQTGSSLGVIRWSHRARFAMALELCRPFAGRRLLDYGCGDGTLLAMLSTSANAPARLVGADINPEVVEDCRRRLGPLGVTFVAANALDGPEHGGAYDAVLCMEVLEHVIDTDGVLRRLVHLLAPRGTLIVSVPVETGLPVIGKQAVRHLAGWAGVGDYPGTSPYTLAELLAAVWAGDRPHVPRPVLSGLGGQPFHDHKGFNWRLVRRQVGTHLSLECTLGSPIRWLPAALNAQAWFVATRR